MPLCLCGQTNLFKLEIILCSLSFACLLLFFILSVVFATFLSLFTLFDCIKALLELLPLGEWDCLDWSSDKDDTLGLAYRPCYMT